jgi:hypothetical protein
VSGLNDVDRSLIDELWATPVGRRWLLKAGVGSAVALGLGAHAAPAPAKRKRRRAPKTETAELHFALGHLRGVSGLTLKANGQRLPLKRHTKASRAALRKRGGLWAAADLSKLSHHVAGVKLPGDRAIAIAVHGRQRGRDVVAAEMIRVPEHATRRLARATRRIHGSYKPLLGSRKQLAELGLERSDVSSATHVAQLEAVVTPAQIALGMVMKHPNVATVNPTAAGITKTVLGADSAVGDLATKIGQMQKAGDPFATLPTAVDANGNPAEITINGTTTTFQTYKFSDDSDFQTQLTTATAASVVAVRDTSSLGAVIDKPLEQEPAASTQTWVQSEGVVPQATEYVPPQLGAGQLSVDIKNPGVYYGTTVQSLGINANGTVPVQIYNNWVRWIWVYVQYLGPGDVNLSLNPGASWPDTPYSQSVGLLSEVSTILGIPIWNDNSIQVTLDFPDTAHTARLLMCGLGSRGDGAGWPQYFPDDAYIGKTAPAECTVTGILTGIVTIGLTAYALASDIDAATTSDEIEEPVSELSKLGSAIVQSITDLGVPVGEAVAVETASGQSDRSANGPNIFELLYPLCAAIPKALFTKGTAEGWAKIGGIIIGDEAESKILDAIPIIGEVIGVLTAVGDAVQLAEVCAESAIAPWVIENEVTVTYPVTVTVSRDTGDATFPRPARSWRLEAKVDGASVLTPITAAINQNGAEPGPLVVNTTAAFGGKQIVWSIVFLDDNGNQVGTGVSDAFTNNDRTNPPNTVAITITEIAEPITAKTRFPRDVTTGYTSSGAGGYVWSSQIGDSGTLADKGIQEVAGVSVSTVTGAAGVVWEQGDEFYVRGVPTVSGTAGGAISLGKASGGGYARRPFLLLDDFAKSGQPGNHVLLEPDPTLDAYHVRPVTLDPVTAAPTWDSSTSAGTFELEVSAAVLHSSGRVIAVNTDSGRLGILFPATPPAQTPPATPPVASYTAGAGNQVGLLSSPTAVAVTNPGTVLVLEPGAMRVSAFDLNGNPARYFTGPSAVAGPMFRLPLLNPGSYLDLAVDGSNQLYLLYYTGDGSAPADYCVDVYSPLGVLVADGIPGVNVPLFAVDYWRNIFAANYDALADTATGQPRIDPALGVAEPSLSVFEPDNPASASRVRRRRGRRRRRRG